MSGVNGMLYAIEVFVNIFTIVELSLMHPFVVLVCNNS